MSKLEKNIQGENPSAAPEVGKEKKKRGPMARFLRWVCIILLSPVVIFLVLTLLLYIPFIQDWAVGVACEKLSESTGKQVNVERVRLKFPLDVDLQKLCITEQSGDTLLAVGNCVLDLDMCGIFGLKVGVDALDLSDVYVDSHDLIATMKLRGRLRDFHVDVHDLEYRDSHVNVTAARLDGCDLDIALQDTTIIDTTTSAPLEWTLDFHEISMKDTRVAFHTPGDTISLRAGINALNLTSGNFDLGHNKLRVDRFNLVADSVVYDLPHEVHMSRGLDPNHLGLYDFTLSLPSLDYDLDAGCLQTSLSSLCFRERCGFELQQLTADVEMEPTGLKVRKAQVKTPTSELAAWADIVWNGNMDVGLSANFSRADVLHLAGGYLPDNVVAQYPNNPLTAEVELTGDINQVNVKACRVIMPGMLDARVSGSADHLLDDDGMLTADLDWDIHTGDLTWLQRVAGLTSVRLPKMDVEGETHIAGQLYRADLKLRQEQGTMIVKGQYNGMNNAYQANVDMRRLAVSRFIPMDSVLVVTANCDVKGQGFDFLSDRTKLRAMLNVPSAHYGSADCGHVNVDAILQRGNGLLNFYSGGDLINADGCVEWMVRQHKVDSASFAFDMRGLDLYTLGAVQKPLKVSMSMHLLGQTNLTDEHYAKGDVSAIQLNLRDTTFYPRDINLEALLTPDTTFAFLSAGDLLFRLNATDGVSTLIDKATVFADSMAVQMEQRQYDRSKLRTLMPEADLCIKSGQHNPLANILFAQTGYTYREFDIDLHTHPERGIRGDGHVYATNTGSIVLDTIAFDLSQDTTGIKLLANVSNGKKNKDVTFDSHLKAVINPNLIGFNVVFNDVNHKKGVDFGAELMFHEGNKRLHLTPLRPVLAYRNFTINEDNFLELRKDGRIDANLELVADDGTGLKIYSTPNEEAEQDLTASLNRFNLGELCAVLPYMPRITGSLHGDVHYLQMEAVTSVMADLSVQEMTYEGCPMGTIGINAAYMPNEDGSHYVDGFMTQNDDQILSFNGLYEDKGSTDQLDAQATLEHFPLSLANGFVGDPISLTGHLLGKVRVTGSTSNPIVDGKILTDEMHILAPMYSLNMRVENDSIEVAGSHLNIDKLHAYTLSNNPLTLDGVVDFRNLSNIVLDINAKAKNFELINAQKNRKAAAYGKVFVNLDAHAKGTTNNLNVTGNLGVLGNTNVTYVLLDSPITVEDEMSDLVTFCDFSDTVEVEEPEFIAPSNVRMRMNVSIDQGALVNCHLSDDGSNYVRLMGGGDLVMTYNGTRGMELFGRYTILEGAMTYTMMVVSLKDCVIQNGSYVEFAGDIGNPRLSISAVERIHSNVTENETPRSVAFDVGLTVSQTLSNMGLEFTLDAPEDLNMKTEISQMTAEQRSKAAVTLMATGMYVSEGSTSGGGFNTTNALNSFLQSQIASITGKALQTIDLSLGVSNNATATGGTTTDYSFRFAKRFWGNRINLIVGGKVSSGSEATNTGQSIIDNVSIEYRLDKSATRYVTLFYDNNNESILEGKITEMGAGLVLRRKTDRLGELFLFRRKEE